MSTPAKASAKTEDARVERVEPLDSKEAKWTRLVKVHYTDPLGQQRDWESAERTTRPENAVIDGVGVVAIIKRPTGPEILLQKQFRPPVGKVCIEIPAGLIDPNESPETCAVRELHEETGYVGTATQLHGGSEGKDKGKVEGVMFNVVPFSADWSFAGPSRPGEKCLDPGFTNTNLMLVHVDIDPTAEANLPQNLKPELEESEFITTFAVPLRDLWAECHRLEAEGCAIDARVGTLAEGIEIARKWGL